MREKVYCEYTFYSAQALGSGGEKNPQGPDTQVSARLNPGTLSAMVTPYTSLPNFLLTSDVLYLSF